MRGKPWSRWAGIVVVGGNVIAQAVFLSSFPIWSFIVIGMCVLVIFALAARWDEAQADMSGTVWLVTAKRAAGDRPSKLSAKQAGSASCGACSASSC